MIVGQPDRVWRQVTASWTHPVSRMGTVESARWCWTHPVSRMGTVESARWWLVWPESAAAGHGLGQRGRGIVLYGGARRAASRGGPPVGAGRICVLWEAPDAGPEFPEDH